MAERLPRAQPDSVANHVTARWARSISGWRALALLATETGRARSKRSAICSGKLISLPVLIRREQEVGLRHLDYICVGLWLTQKVQFCLKFVYQGNRVNVSVTEANKKLRYREEHSASVLLSWCTLWHFSGENLLMSNQPLLRNIGHESYRIRRNNAK